jgi:hypothetical protein
MDACPRASYYSSLQITHSVACVERGAIHGRFTATGWCSVLKTSRLELTGSGGGTRGGSVP